jgi:hypothetical protein
MCYFELRPITAPHPNLASEIAHHLQSRQHLGKAIVICERPVNLVSTTRKQWFKLARTLQKERASTINAEKILRLTSTITHMHRMQFATKTPLHAPEAHVFFIQPEDAAKLMVPINTYSFYMASPLDINLLQDCIGQLPSDATIVDFADTLSGLRANLRQKSELVTQMRQCWDEVLSFLHSQNIVVESLTSWGAKQAEAIDDALDTLLGTSHRFLQLASNLHQLLELAQPIALTSRQQQEYDMLMLLAYRVQALNPSSFATTFTYNLTDENTFFLHDIGTQLIMEQLASDELIARHQQAGRKRLAQALQFAPPHYLAIEAAGLLNRMAGSPEPALTP